MTHGTATGYAYHGCRCAECRAAQRARMREYRNARTAIVPSTPARSMEATTEKCPGDVGASRGVAQEEVPS